MSRMCCRLLQTPAPKRLKQLMFMSPVITIASLVLLLWNMHFQDNKFPYLTNHYQGAAGRVIPTNQVSGATLTAPQEQTDSFVAVNMTKTVLLSAYLEHRYHRRKVRVLAVVLRSETVAYRCVLYCQEKLHVSVGFSYIHTDDFGFPYGTADIMCYVPSDCKMPSQVAVVTDGDISEDKNNFIFLEVKNQEKKINSLEYYFVVCFSTMFDFTNVLQLVQSLEMLQILGVNRVVVYKTSCSPETQRVLDHYTKTGLLEVIPWSMSRFLNVSRGWLPEHDPGDLHYFGQIPALNDCVYRYMYRSRYVALHDVDELILPQSVNSWVELLPHLESKYGPNKCYMFENNVFPSNILLTPASNQTRLQRDRWKSVSGVNILDHLHQEPVAAKTRYENFKVIVNPQAVFITSVHGVLSSVSGCAWVDRNIARLYHTRAQRRLELTPDQLIYDGRLLNYSSRLTPAVSAALKESGLLPDDSST